MSVQRERKIGLLLIGSVLAIIVLFSMLTSCSQYSCPTYDGVDRNKYKVFKPYYLSKPWIKTKKHL